VREVADALALDPEAVERFLNRAARLGRVAKVADNRFFLPQTVAHLAGIARDLAATAPQGAFTAVAFNARTGVGRNLTIQILEYLDKIGATRRVGDARVAEAFG
jgi:selenocysteine-specific elongation factor